MPLIKNGTEIDDIWTFVDTNADNPPPFTGEVGHEVGRRGEATSALPDSSPLRPAPQATSPAGGGGCTYPLTVFLERADALFEANTPVGVRLSPDDDPHALEPYLQKLALIEISFPKYTDGRGYSQAQLLRRRLGYEGELRAVGHVLTDQILYMHRSGFDAYSTTRANLSSVLKALNEYSAFYQPAADGNNSVFARRHEKA